MKVLLIYPDINTIQFYHYQHGLAWISAVLKKAGHEVELLYLDRELGDDEFVEQVRRRGPEVVAFSSTTQQFLFTRRYASALKKALPKFMVIGGIHATIDPEKVMGLGLFDALIRQEGEYPLLDLLNALQEGRDWTNIENLWARMPDQSVKRNPLRAPVDLARLPWPDRDLFDNQALMKHNDGQIAVMASRGCPFRCTYCCNTVLSDLAGGNRNWVRQRPLEDVMAEIQTLHERFPEMKSLIFMDEIFTQKKRWVQEFCAAYRKKFTTPFQVFLRVETVDREMMEEMKDAGLYSIIVGVESGNEQIRQTILNRRMTNDKIIQVFKWADELGLETWDFNMIGVPGDTESTIRDTMELNRLIRPHHLQISIFYPFPATPLYDRCVAEGLAKVDESTSVFHSRPVLDLPGLSREKLLALHREFVALGHQIEAQKSAAGYADLAALYGGAVVEAPGPEYAGLWRVRIEGEDRMCILMHPPGKAVYRVNVRPRSRLSFGMAFSADVWDKPGGGAFFEISVKRKLRRELVIFSEYVDPKNNLDHRRWLDRELDLTMFGGKTVELTLSTRTGPGQNQFCAAFWSRPFLEDGR
jgi:radical SAM superfamily enzyme YgiQ (UPF0313 family)